MTNPRDYPDTIQSAESGRPLRRGVKMLTIDADGQPFTYGQPGWWVAIDDPTDNEGQPTYRVGTLSEFAEWTKSVVRDPKSADGMPKKWFDSEETVARAASLDR